jgi:hypothetical protein
VGWKIMDSSSVVPPPPPGFKLVDDKIPPPPPGFKLQEAQGEKPAQLTGIEKTRNFLMTGKTTGPGHFSPEDRGTFDFPPAVYKTAMAVGAAEGAYALTKIPAVARFIASESTEAASSSIGPKVAEFVKSKFGTFSKKKQAEAVKSIINEIRALKAPESPTSPKPNVAIIESGGKGFKSVPDVQPKAATPAPTAQPSPNGKLSGPGEKPIKYESVKRTDTGAELRRDNFKAGIAKDHPTMTREDFMKLTAKQKNELIRKYNPQSQNRPYIESSGVFKEFADHVWPL